MSDRVLQFTRQNNALDFSLATARKVTPVRYYPVTAGGLPFLHPWKFTPNAALDGGTLLQGAVYIGGVPVTLGDWPTDGDLGEVTATTNYWVEIDFENAIAKFDSDEDVPDNEASKEYWHVLRLTVEDEEITEVWNPWTCDIRALLNP